MTAVIRQGLNEDWNVYAMYSYKTEKTLPVGSAYSKSTDRQFLVGTEYYVYNQGSLKVKPFLEWQATRTKYENDTKDRSRDFKTVIGLRDILVIYQFNLIKRADSENYPLFFLACNFDFHPHNTAQARSAVTKRLFFERFRFIHKN